MAIKISGNWKKGLAFDVHTLDSTYLGVDENGHHQWENTRSDMGEFVYTLKYIGVGEGIVKQRRPGPMAPIPRQRDKVLRLRDVAVRRVHAVSLL